MVKRPNLPKMPQKLDGGTVATMAGALVALYLAVMLGQTVKRNYDLGHQIDTLNKQIALLKEQNQQLQFNLTYYQTDSFAEREARAKLGLQKPGEGVIILPPKSTPAPTKSAPIKDKRSNLRQWIDFLSGKG